jgi:TorA maturation chaperone TorD
MSDPQDILDLDQAARREPFDEAVCRSVVYGILSLGLQAPSQADTARLRDPATRQALLDAARVLQPGYALLPPIAGAGHATAARDSETAFVTRALEFAELLPQVEPEALHATHGRLFGHTARGLVCPYEAEYGQDGLFQQPQSLADICGFYEAFGLACSESTRERPDHIGCELEFMEFLARKEAWALAARDSTMQAVTCEAMRLFLKDHLGRFARAFGLVLAQSAPGGFFGSLGELLYDFVTLECARQRVASGPAVLRLRPAEEDDVPMQCGPVCDPTACGLGTRAEEGA